MYEDSFSSILGLARESKDRQEMNNVTVERQKENNNKKKKL